MGNIKENNGYICASNLRRDLSFFYCISLGFSLCCELAMIFNVFLLHLTCFLGAFNPNIGKRAMLFWHLMSLGNLI